MYGTSEQLLTSSRLCRSCVKPSRAPWRWRAWKCAPLWPASETAGRAARAVKAKPPNSTNCGTVTPASRCPENTNQTPPTPTTSPSDPTETIYRDASKTVFLLAGFSARFQVFLSLLPTLDLENQGPNRLVCVPVQCVFICVFVRQMLPLSHFFKDVITLYSKISFVNNSSVLSQHLLTFVNVSSN